MYAGILVTQSRIEAVPLQLKHDVLTTDCQGSPLSFYFSKTSCCHNSKLQWYFEGTVVFDPHNHKRSAFFLYIENIREMKANRS